VDVTVTVIRPSTGVRADARITAPDLQPAGSLLDDLRRLVHAGSNEPIHVDGRVLDPLGTARGCELTDGQVLVVGASVVDPTPRGTPAGAGTFLVVTAGPGAGGRVPLAATACTVGRAADCDLHLADPAVSRRHLSVVATADDDPGAGVVTDLGSRNGTTVDGHPLVAHHPVRIGPGQRIRVGACELRILTRQPAARLLPSSDNRLLVHRSPRTPPAPCPVEIRFPPAPVPPTPTRLPVLAALAPVVVGLLLAELMHQWQLLAFTVLSPVMIAGQAFGDRRSSRRTHRGAVTAHSRDLAIAHQAVTVALDDEGRRRHAAAPDLGTLAGAALDRSSELWQRGAGDIDAMTLRLGRGDLPSEVTVADGPPQVAVDVPVCLRLSEVGVLGIAGPGDTVTALARSLVVQAATLHGPSQCRIVVVAPGRTAEWEWVRWLPHTLPVAGEACTSLLGTDEPQARARLAELATADTTDGTRATLLLVDATAAPGARVFDDALDTLTDRCCTVWLAHEESRLPAGCRTVLARALEGGQAITTTQSMTLRTPGADALEVHPDLVTREVAETLARALAPLRDAVGGVACLPNAVSWSDVGPIDLTEDERATTGLIRAGRNGPSTVVPLGRGPAGDVVVDLAADGPHALVAGTTGSGKSELLQTLVAGLAAANRPQDLALLLVDFKGGAAFGSCRRLPHTVGVVTDLDTASTERALRSLQAELRRRESLLADVGATDLDGYAAGADQISGAAPRPPRLVIVVDEFATLVEELPDFVGGLVGIAQRGRSLGVHLVLATQRPEGVVSADIRANTRLRICLAVARESDSRDVVDAPHAAAIGRDTPGRGYLRAGPGELTVVQTAWVGGDTATSHLSRVTLSPVEHLGRPPVPDSPGTSGRTDLERLTDAALEAARRLGEALPAPPWLPPLPDLLPTTALPQAPPGHAVWGLVDLPAQQRQVPLSVDLTDGGTLLIAGTARSGRSTAVRAVVAAAAGALPPDRLHVWAIDGGGGLSDLDGLPHCGGVLPAYDVDRLDRLVTWTAEEVGRRRVEGWSGHPLLMLAVDGWEALLAQAADHDGGRLIETLLRLATDGPAAGLRLIVTAGRGGLTGRLGALTADRLVLRLTDRSDYALIGMPGRDVPGELPPGRAVRGLDLAVAQIAMPEVSTVAVAWPTPCGPGVRRVDPLPRVVTLADLGGTEASPAGRVLRLGLRADDHVPALHDPADGGGVLLVAGPPRSGRSSTLVLLARQLDGAPLAILCPRRSPLADQEAPGVVHLPADDQAHAVAVLEAMTSPGGDPPAVLIDDADLLPDGPLAEALVGLVRRARDGRTLVVLAGPTDGFVAAFRGPVAEARRARAGVLLRPAGAHDGELFGVRLPRRDARQDPPGRGWLALHGEATAIQVATV
jgi:S-DNA-T family DNA segregation ATPase FtsK/SpoIIIE